MRRLRNLVHVLRDDDENEVVVEVDSPEWPGLNATANLLVTSPYLHHADKDVRLYTVLACIEILTIVRICYFIHSNRLHGAILFLTLDAGLILDGAIVRARCAVGGTRNH